MFDQKRGWAGPMFGTAMTGTTAADPFKLKMPDPHEAMKLVGVRDLSDAEIAEQKARTGKRVKSICFCGDPHCGIGPFTRAVEEE